MTLRSRRKALLLIAVAGVAMLSAALALPNLTLGPGMPVPDLGSSFVSESGNPGTLMSAPVSDAGRWILAAVLVLVSLALLAATFRYLSRKPLLKVLARGLGAILGLAGLVVLVGLIPGSAGPSMGASAVPLPLPPLRGPLGPTPPILAALLGLGLLAAVAGVVLWLRKPRPEASQGLALAADRALRSLRSGDSLRGVVIGCYREMSEVLAADAGLERGADMTPGEFETLVVASGIPAGPVRDLTRLFERVRYSRDPVGSSDEERAVRCLELLRHAARSRKEGRT